MASKGQTQASEGPMRASKGPTWVFKGPIQAPEGPIWWGEIDGWTDGRTDGRTDGWTDGRTEILPCSTGLRPLWVRCPASLRVTFKNEKQGTGTADHMISLDYLFLNYRTLL